VRLVRKGEARAFDELASRYLRGALAVALDYARDRDEAEDIVQDAFVRVVRALHRFDDRLSFRPWFYSILRNLGRNAVERRGRIAHVEVPDSIAATTPSADVADDAELRAIVERELAGMTRLQAAAFRLLAVEGFSALEVGDMLGIAPATARTHAHRARLKLRDTLARHGYGSDT
jgi:RNA polymerase sigma-70 factor, ECF subfamily